MRKIKFFSKHDLSIGFFIKEVEKKLDNLREDTQYKDIEDILELYNVKLFIENDIFLKTWTKFQIENYKNKISFIDFILKDFFLRINNLNIIDIIANLSVMYSNDFWKLFEKYEIYRKIEEENFKKIINQKKYYITEILSHKKLVNYYGKVIREYFMENINTGAELLINAFLSEKEENEKQLFIPKSLTRTDKEKIMNMYVESDLNKFNYLKIILKSTSQKDLVLTPFFKREVKKAYDNILEKYFKNNDSYSYGVSLKFEENQFYGKVKSEKEYDKKFISERSYSLNWILENLDYPTLLNNFIYLFDFVDENFLFTNLNIENNSYYSILFEPRAKNEYITDLDFNLKETITNGSLILYYNILKDKNIRLEEVLEWFFNEYLVKEFNIRGFSIKFPSESLTYLEKCKCIIGEMERSLKEFNLYKDYGEIDEEILELTNKPLKFEEVGSLTEEKYIYIKENSILENILFSLFDNQSSINYIKDVKKSYNNFIEMLIKEKITKSMFEDYQLFDIEFLLKEKYICENKNGELKLNYNLIFILKKLYNKKVLCREYLKEFEKEIEFLKNKDMLEFESKLFSRKEVEYINYFLNSKFSNGLGLRNKYAHGTHSLEEENHKKDYFKFLEIFILIIIKLNEEFCIVDDKNKFSSKVE